MSLNNKTNLIGIVESVEKSISDHNHFLSLAGCFILIDICSKIYQPSVNQNNKRYKMWVKDCLLPNIDREISENKYLSASNIWFLRNSILHEGSADPSTSRDYERWGTEKVHDIVPTVFPLESEKKILLARVNNTVENQEYPTLFFDIYFFCNSVIKSSKDWIEKNEEIIDKSNLNLYSTAGVLINKHNPSHWHIIRL